MVCFVFPGQALRVDAFRPARKASLWQKVAAACFTDELHNVAFILAKGQALETLPTHDSNDIFFIDVPSSRMISEDTKIVAELSKESVSGLTDGIQGFFVDDC